MQQLKDIEQYLNDNYFFRENLVDGLFYFRYKKEEMDYQILNENTLWRELHNEKNFNVKISDIMNLLKSDFTEKFDPINEYFLSLKKIKSKVCEIEKLCTYITIDGDNNEQLLFNLAFKKHLIRSVACAIGNQQFNKHCLVFVSKKQNNGKSTICRWLCPPALKNCYAENITTDKDSLIALTENFIINLDELSTLMKSEINSLKSIFSKDAVKVRRPYERKAIVLKRRCSFFGSTNRAEFLSDESGSVRWLCFNIKNIDWKYIDNIDIDKIWASAYQLYIVGFNYNLDLIEVNNNEERNQSFSITNIEEELIKKEFVPSEKDNAEASFFTTTEISLHLNTIYNTKQTLSILQIGKALTRLNFNKTQKWNGHFQEKGYWVIYNTKIK